MSTTATLCNEGNTGSLTVTLPAYQVSVLLNEINNPNGVAWYAFIQVNSNTSNMLSGTSYRPQVLPGWPPDPVAGDFLVLNSTASSVNSFTFNNLAAGYYQINIYYYNSLYYDSNGLPNVIDFSNPTAWHATQATISSNPSIPSTFCGCTDPTADNYDSTANVDDGTCLYSGGGSTDPDACLCGDGSYSITCCPPDPVGGCTDTNATNFRSFANFDDGSCEYGDINACISGCEGVTTVVPACIPDEINQLLDYNKKCIAASGNRYYTKHITGLSDSCSNMDSWKMIIIDDLMSRKGLPCLYNCTDASTPSLEDASIDCLQIWKDSGSIEWDPADIGTYVDGSVVLRNNAVYTATGDSGLAIDPISKNPDNGWKKCNDLAIRNETKDYLPNFLKFVGEYCKDCDIPSYRQDDPQAVQISESYSVGGNNITINGSTLNT